jgi:hypothetical protein
MRLLRTIALICLSSSVIFAQTAAQDWRFAHPGATLIGSFHIKAFFDSPLVGTLIKQAVTKDPSNALIAGMILQGVDKVSEVRFSIRDMGKGQNPDVLALVTCALDDAAARAMTQGKTSVRRIDANTILLGEGQSLEDAVVRMSKPATGLQARALDRSKALANFDLWLAGTLPEIPMTFPVLDSLRGLALGVSATDDLRMELDLETASAKVAEDLVSSARRSQATQSALGPALLTEVDGSTARFKLVMEGNKVIQAVQEAMDKKGGQSPLAAFAGLSPTPDAPVTFKSSAPPKPMQGTIRIFGLDEGTREIKIDPQH